MNLKNTDNILYFKYLEAEFNNMKKKAEEQIDKEKIL